MSKASEWFLAVHRFIWNPLFYPMGLERDAIDVPIGGWRRPVPVEAPLPRKTAASVRPKRRKAA
jgi:hypothetical protein